MLTAPRMVKETEFGLNTESRMARGPLGLGLLPMEVIRALYLMMVQM